MKARNWAGVEISNAKPAGWGGEGGHTGEYIEMTIFGDMAYAVVSTGRDRGSGDERWYSMNLREFSPAAGSASRHGWRNDALAEFWTFVRDTYDEPLEKILEPSGNRWRGVYVEGVEPIHCTDPFFLEGKCVSCGEEPAKHAGSKSAASHRPTATGVQHKEPAQPDVEASEQEPPVTEQGRTLEDLDKGKPPAATS